IDPVVELVLVDKVGPLVPVSQGIDCKDLYALAAVRLEDLTVELGYLLLAVATGWLEKENYSYLGIQIVKAVYLPYDAFHPHLMSLVAYQCGFDLLYTGLKLVEKFLISPGGFTRQIVLLGKGYHGCIHAHDLALVGSVEHKLNQKTEHLLVASCHLDKSHALRDH